MPESLSRPPKAVHHFRRVAILFAGGPAPGAGVRRALHDRRRDAHREHVEHGQPGDQQQVGHREEGPRVGRYGAEHGTREPRQQAEPGVHAGETGDVEQGKSNRTPL